MRKGFRMMVVLGLLFFLAPVTAHSESIGVYCWQLAPYTDVVCFDVDNRGFAYALTGWDHVPGEYKYCAYGAVLFDNYFNNYWFEWTADVFAHFAAAVSTTTLEGNWIMTYTTPEPIDGGALIFLGPGPQIPGTADGIGALMSLTSKRNLLGTASSSGK